MAYHLEKNNPYNHKKFSFKRKVKSTISTILLVGITVSVTARLQSQLYIAKATEKYQTAISYYQDVIETTASFFKENQVDNPEACFELYTKLLWNGYFSNGREYQYDMSNNYNVIGNYGLRVATGTGDCKNNEDFFYKLMKELGYQVYQVVGVQMQSGEILFSPAEMLFGNHIITVVEYEGKEYYFDTTNFCSYEKIGCNYVANENKNLIVQLRPITGYLYGYNTLRDTIKLYQNQILYESGTDYEIDDDLSATMNGEKVLVLRKAIEPSLQNICANMLSEG